MTDPYGGVRAASPGKAPPGVCLVHRVKAATNRAWPAALGDGQWRTADRSSVLAHERCFGGLLATGRAPLDVALRCEAPGGGDFLRQTTRTTHRRRRQ
jgi:hypothetical protein